MASRKSTQAASAASVNDSSNFTPPVRSNPTPVTLDPYIRPETLRGETLSFGGVDLPPILTGYELGRGFDGQALDYLVQVIHISRQQIDAVLRAIGREHPELETVLSIMSKYMCTLDTMRSEMGLGVACAKSWLRGTGSILPAPCSSWTTSPTWWAAGMPATACTCAE